MLFNIPTAEQLNDNALRLYFDAWQKITTLLCNFEHEFSSTVPPWDEKSEWSSEWSEYIEEAQPELTAIAATTQQSAEVRLKSLLCETNPFILLLKSDIKFKQTRDDIDFSDQKTLDAVDLPAAVLTLTSFNLPQTYIEQYTSFRRLRNKFVHTGMYQGHLELQDLAVQLTKQYATLWPDEKWLLRRTEYDGSDATSYFHDERWASAHSNVMYELPTTIKLFNNELFKKCVGTSKSSLKGICPICINRMASKTGEPPEPTVARISKLQAKCYMCETDLCVSEEIYYDQCDCSTNLEVSTASGDSACCFNCGELRSCYK